MFLYNELGPSCLPCSVAEVSADATRATVNVRARVHTPVSPRRRLAVMAHAAADPVELSPDLPRPQTDKIHHAHLTKLPWTGVVEWLRG